MAEPTSTAAVGLGASGLALYRVPGCEEAVKVERLFPPGEPLAQMQERMRSLQGDIARIGVEDQRIRVDSMTRWG